MKSRKMKRNSKKKRSGDPKFNKERGTYDFTVSVLPDQYRLVREDSSYLGVDPEMYVSMMVHTMILEMKMIGDEQESVHGVRFAHPEDCDCCHGESLKEFGFLKNFKVH